MQAEHSGELKKYQLCHGGVGNGNAKLSNDWLARQ
jgi:hypothetical protein